MNLDTFFNNFHLLTDTPNGIRKLRELILLLAMQGKLVPQNSNDESGSLLLERIYAEKERLIKKKNIKKIKPFKNIVTDEIPYEIPATWKWVRLGDVINYDGAIKVKPENIPPKSWVLGLEEIEKDTSRVIKYITFEQQNSKSTKTEFKKYDVLYGKLRPYLNKVIVAERDGYCTTEIIPLRGYLGIIPKYLMYSLKRKDFIIYVNSKTYGVKMPRLGTNDGKNALFPLAPIMEQERIVTKVDHLMALCNEIEKKLIQSKAVGESLIESVVNHIST